MVVVVCVLVDFEVGGEGRGGFLLTGLAGQIRALLLRAVVYWFLLS